MCNCCNDREASKTPYTDSDTCGPMGGGPINISEAEFEAELKEMDDEEIDEMVGLGVEAKAEELKKKRDDLNDAEFREESHVEVADAFQYHPATDITGPKHDRVRRFCADLAHELIETCPPSTELDTALDKVREAMFWANAAVALG